MFVEHCEKQEGSHFMELYLQGGRNKIFIYKDHGQVLRFNILITTSKYVYLSINLCIMSYMYNLSLYLYRLSNFYQFYFVFQWFLNFLQFHYWTMYNIVI